MQVVLVGRFAVSRYPQESGLFDDATSRPLPATARVLRIQRRVFGLCSDHRAAALLAALMV